MRRGFTNASLDEIAKAAGVSRQTLYLHFDSKTDLMTAAAADLGAEIRQLLRGLVPVLMDGDRQALRGWLSAALAGMEQHRDIARATQESQLEEPARAAESVREVVLRAVDPWILRWPPDRRAEARVRFELCRLQLQHYAWGSTREVVPVPGDIAIDVLTDLWWGTLMEPLAAVHAKAGDDAAESPQGPRRAGGP